MENLPFDPARLAACAAEIVANTRELSALGWTPATSSNFSMRMDDRHAAITVSGRDKGRLVAEDIMVVDFAGQPVATPHRPSAETLLHTQIYARYPEIGCVLHTHSHVQTVASRLYAPQGHLHLEGYELLKAFHGNHTHEMAIDVPVLANTQDMPELAARVETLLDQQPMWGYLIDGHGLYAWGRTMAEARIPVRLRARPEETERMSRLRIFDEADPSTPISSTEDLATIAARLRDIGVRFEQWQAAQPVLPGARPDEVMAAYRADIDKLVAENGFKTVDVVSIAPDNPNKDAMRAKFLDEHFHKEDEVRFFVAGSGLFTLHVGDKVYEIRCEQGDLVGVPDGTTHWFDMGPEPSFVAIRFFTEPDGWVGHFTGTDIARRFPRYEPGQAG